MRSNENPFGVAMFVAAAFTVGLLVVWMARGDIVLLIQDAIEMVRRMVM